MVAIVKCPEGHGNSANGNFAGNVACHWSVSARMDIGIQMDSDIAGNAANH
jgi:hypothetical protein